MLLRSLTWLAAITAVAAVLMAIESAPADPVPQVGVADTNHSRTAVAIYGCADRDPRLGSIVVAEWEGDATDPFGPPGSPAGVGSRQPGFVRPAAWLAAYGGSAARTHAVMQVVEALGLASGRSLDAPVFIQSDLTFQETGRLPSYGGARPTLTGVFPQAATIVHRNWGDHLLSAAPWTILELTDAVLAVGDERDVAAMNSRWRSGQTWVDILGVVNADRGMEAVDGLEFYATHALNPFSEPYRDRELIRLLTRRFDVVVEAQLGPLPGFLYNASSSTRTEVRQLLSDPRLIRLAQESSGSWRRRAAAWRAAMVDDDPVLADFAAICMVSALNDGLHLQPVELPVELLETWPYRTKGQEHECLSELAVAALERLEPTEAARRIARMAKSSVDADGVSELLAALLLHQTLEIRVAAESACLAHLPRQVVGRVANLMFWPDWPGVERDAFVTRLIDRLRAEVWNGNASRAFAIAKELTLRDFRFVSDGVDSRIVELIVDLAFDPQHGRDFRLQAGQKCLAEAANERLRHSDPAMRWAARLLLGEWDKSWGDGYLKALRVLDETGDFPAYEAP